MQMNVNTGFGVMPLCPPIPCQMTPAAALCRGACVYWLYFYPPKA